MSLFLKLTVQNYKYIKNATNQEYQTLYKFMILYKKTVSKRPILLTAYNQNTSFSDIQKA